jgi:hypothetical protein
MGRKRTFPESMACPHCGATFKPRSASSKFCSNACLGKSRRKYGVSKKEKRPHVSKQCLRCGVGFQITEGSNRRGGGNLCRPCILHVAGKVSRRMYPFVGGHNTHWKGGVTRDIKAWLKKWRPEYRRRTIAKCNARDKARNAIRTGVLVRGLCVDCGSSSNIHAHHEDYSKPLEVIWLCRTCHNKRHGKLRHLNMEVSNNAGNQPS